ncbi:hypothetical protein B0I35DRAFT_408616 [Stachybotrys elegans]|uniref:Mid2 domain-containing protein n=1 Tax=Stachybotrys elegans TaxID=80388 RepID=A0A8K0SQC4_9HYPO|nr:hypothetical protein B0I35DRAFT_408616 [Stachybotrys elegans]
MPSFSFNIWRLPHATALVVVSTLFALCDAHAVPRQTKTIPFHELDVVSWPLAPTPGPSHALFERQLNTICGYIGGDPGLPATCSAGSHCAADVNQEVLGCCPNDGPCTQGIYSGCVDVNSAPPTEVNPYIYTCTGRNVCYRNTFDGGYYQYGCGSASSVAATVAATASGQLSLDIARVTAPWTATATSLEEPTTLGSVTSRTTASEAMSTTETASSEATETDGRTVVASPESTTTANVPTEAPAANKGNDNTGAIVGGTVGAFAGILALVALGIFLWRRKNGNTRKGPGPKQGTEFIKSPIDGNGHHAFAPVPTMQENSEYGNVITPLPQASPTAYDPGRYRNELDNTQATAGGARALSPLRDDEVPLTATERETEEFSTGFHTGPSDARDGYPAMPSHYEARTSYSPARGQSRVLWQQNLSNRNPTWL